MAKKFRMITSERVAMLMLATVLSLWCVIELYVNKHVASEPVIADSIIIEKIDTILPVKEVKDKSKRKKEKKKSSSKKSKPKAIQRQDERDYFEDLLTE